MCLNTENRWKILHQHNNLNCMGYKHSQSLLLVVLNMYFWDNSGTNFVLVDYCRFQRSIWCKKKNLGERRFRLYKWNMKMILVLSRILLGIVHIRILRLLNMETFQKGIWCNLLLLLTKMIQKDMENSWKRNSIL